VQCPEGRAVQLLRAATARDQANDIGKVRDNHRTKQKDQGNGK
jgi:hypothetical protein